METVIEKSVKIICKLFGNIKELKPYQEQCIKSLINLQDCFVCQPTGQGKSIVFQSLPFFKTAIDLYESGVLDKNKDPTDEDVTKVKESCSYAVIVISPLTSLIKDQEMQLRQLGIRVCTLAMKKKGAFDHVADKMEVDVNILQDVANSNIIFTSPEAILQNHREILKEKKFGQRLLAFAVDESHCIKKWGSSVDRTQAFRKCYSDLSELRSLVFQKVPVVALTATATEDTKSVIIESLSLFNPNLLISTPDRENIKFCKVIFKSRDIEQFLQPLIEKMATQSYKMEKVLIFCRLMRDVRDLYKVFEQRFGSRYSTYKIRPYAKFHSKTDETIKNHVMREFSKESGTIRILIATIAFGMGVNCRELYTVVHFGPPATLEDYFQHNKCCNITNILIENLKCN